MYVKPESVFAQTALEMVAIHGPEAGTPDEGMCDRCQQPLPCPPVRNAILVLEAAGLSMHPAGSSEARRAAAEAAHGQPARELERRGSFPGSRRAVDRPAEPPAEPPAADLPAGLTISLPSLEIDLPGGLEEDLPGSSPGDESETVAETAEGDEATVHAVA